MEKINQKERSSKGGFASIVGIVANLLLATGKILVGSLFGLVSVVADGLNNLTDCGSSVVSIISFKLSSKPADKEHPYGHERIEYICSLTVAFLVMLVAFDTAKESIGSILSPEAVDFSWWIIAVLIASLAVKLCLFFFYRTVAKKIDSSILFAAASDSLMDCVSTSVTLLCFIFGTLSGYYIDGYAGVFVSLFIAWSAIGLLKEIFSNIIGRAPDKETVDEIKKRIMSHGGVLGVHDVSVYSYGPSKFFASAHIEVSASVDVLISHELVDDIERDFIENTNITLTGHLDPIENENEEVSTIRAEMESLVKSIDDSFNVHDLRIVIGERRTNVLFDIAIPFDAKQTKDEVKKAAEDALFKINPKYCPIITVEYTI